MPNDDCDPNFSQQNRETAPRDSDILRQFDERLRDQRALLDSKLDGMQEKFIAAKNENSLELKAQREKWEDYLKSASEAFTAFKLATQAQINTLVLATERPVIRLGRYFVLSSVIIGLLGAVGYFSVIKSLIKAELQEQGVIQIRREIEANRTAAKKAVAEILELRANAETFEYAFYWDENSAPENDAGASMDTTRLVRKLNKGGDSQLGSIKLSDHTLVLKKGKYYVDASCPAYAAGRHLTVLENATNTNATRDVLVGTAEMNANGVVTRSFVRGILEVQSEEEKFRLSQYTENGRDRNGQGVGKSGSSNETVAVYSQIFIIKMPN